MAQVMIHRSTVDLIGLPKSLRTDHARRVAGLLWVLGPPEALPTFLAIAQDKSKDVAARLIAVEALGGLNDIKAGEALGGTLISIVNLYYYQDLMAGARAAIARGGFADYVAEVQEQWTAKRDQRPAP